MKQLSAIVMATAMLCQAYSAEAKVSYEEAMRLKSEGRAMEQLYKTRDPNALRPLKPKHVSLFHEKLAEKSTESVHLYTPSKVTSLGDNIFGYLGYSDDSAIDLPTGYYELGSNGAKLLWKDPNIIEMGLGFKNAAKVDDKIAGYIQDEVFGMLYGIYYAEVDAETGALLTIEQQDIDKDKSYIGVFAYNPEDETFYGYGSYNGTRCFLSAPAWEPFNYKMIKQQQGKEMCLSMCYNPVEKAIVGVNLNYELVKIGTNGRQTKIMDLNINNGDSYVTGIVYSPRSNLYYWNINYKDGTAAMATIDPMAKKVDIYEKLNYCEEYYNLMTTDEYVGNSDEPMRPEAGAPDFGKGELTGYVPFTIPSKTKGGNDITGEVEYTTYLNGEVYTTGKIAVGNEKDEAGNAKPTTVMANFAVPQPGKYSFSLSVKAAGLESAKASTYAWIGNDTPVNPTNVRLTKKADSTEPGAYILTWNPVTQGTHGGYIDVEKVEYRIRINGSIHTSRIESIDLTLPTDQAQGVYTAEVKAVCNGLESDWTSSNEVTEGVALELPVYIRPNPEQYEMCLVVDNNGDGRTWTLEESTDPDNPHFIQTNFTTNKDIAMDDWFFLPKMKIEDASSIYSFSMDAGLRNNSFRKEYLEVLLCDKPNTDGVISTIIKEYSPESSNFETAGGVFEVQEHGEYYIAIHCKSAGYQMGVKARNFKVDKSDVTYDAPAAVKDIEVTPGREGELKANITFQMPTNNIGNEEIPSSTILEATISSPVETIVVKGEPGQKISAAINTEQGNNVITVQVSDGNRKSPISKTSVYTGVYIPATPKITSVDYTPDMLSMTLEWEPVDIGDDGEGYVDPNAVVYDIYQLDMNSGRWELHQQDITENSYTYEKESGSRQELIMLGVLSRNEAGDNGELVTATGVLGTPYNLPIAENFDEEGKIYSNPWLTTYLYGDTGSWGLYYNSDVTGENKDTGVSMIAQGENGVISRLGTPKFSTKGLENVSVTLELLRTKLPTVRILADKYGEEPEIIAEITSIDFQNKREKMTFPLPAEYLDEEWAGLYIEADFDDDGQILAIESISIDGEKSSVDRPQTSEKTEYFNLSGLRLSKPTNGINIKITNGKASKVMIND